jgi:hypothetical protein
MPASELGGGQWHVLNVSHAWHAGLVYRGACPVNASQTDIAYLRNVLNVGNVVRSFAAFLQLYPNFNSDVTCHGSASTGRQRTLYFGGSVPSC